jgi:N-acetylglucosamine-6-phosphate deacetylase
MIQWSLLMGFKFQIHFLTASPQTCSLFHKSVFGIFRGISVSIGHTMATLTQGEAAVRQGLSFDLCLSC